MNKDNTPLDDALITVMLSIEDTIRDIQKETKYRNVSMRYETVDDEAHQYSVHVYLHDEEDK